MSYSRTEISEFEEKIGKSRATLFRWAKQGCDLRSEDSVQAWIERNVAEQAGYRTLEMRSGERPSIFALPLDRERLFFPLSKISFLPTSQAIGALVGKGTIAQPRGRYRGARFCPSRLASRATRARAAPRQEEIDARLVSGLIFCCLRRLNRAIKSCRNNAGLSRLSHWML